MIASYFCFDCCKIFLSINVQNERVANIFDVVRKGLGMLPQQAEQAIFEKSQDSEFSKMSKLVHVYTACEFVKWYLFTLLDEFVKWYLFTLLDGIVPEPI